MAGVWIWGRRIGLGGMASLFAFVAWLVARQATGLEGYAGVLLLACLSLVAGWVALFGGGMASGPQDDRRIHARRIKRYE